MENQKQKNQKQLETPPKPRSLIRGSFGWRAGRPLAEGCNNMEEHHFWRRLGHPGGNVVSKNSVILWQIFTLAAATLVCLPLNPFLGFGSGFPRAGLGLLAEFFGFLLPSFYRRECVYIRSMAENVASECRTVLGFYFESVCRKCDFMTGNLTFGGGRAVKDLRAHSAEMIRSSMQDLSPQSFGFSFRRKHFPHSRINGIIGFLFLGWSRWQQSLNESRLILRRKHESFALYVFHLDLCTIGESAEIRSRIVLIIKRWFKLDSSDHISFILSSGCSPSDASKKWELSIQDKDIHILCE